MPVGFSAGTAKYTIQLNGIPFQSSEPLCTQTDCPKLAGEHIEQSLGTFPDVSGKLVSTVSWYTESGQQIWCVESTFRVGRRLRGEAL